MRLSATLRPVTRLTGSLGVATITTFGDATAEAADILLGETAYIATGKVTGTCTFDADTSDATAVESDILLGKTAYVDGEKKTGTSTLNAETTDATLTANDMLYGVTGYGADGTKLTGAGAYWQHIINAIYLFKSATTLPNPTVMTLQNCTAAISWSDIAFPNNLINLICTFSNNLANLDNFLNGATTLESFTLTSETSHIINYNRSFLWCRKLHTIVANLDFSSATNVTNLFYECFDLCNIMIVPSTIKISMAFASSPLLSTASLLSIANGLDSTVAPKTLTMHSTAKTNMDNINVDVVDGMAILGTTKTLMQFVNTGKGWTVA